MNIGRVSGTTRVPRPTTTRRHALAATLVTIGLVATACADTVVEVGGTTVDEGTASGKYEAPSTAPSTTLPIAGTPSELLVEMATDMSALSGQISGDGNERATLSRIDAIWVIARPDVEATEPQLVEGIDTSVSMARTAVVRIRPADADRAFSLLTGLVDQFTGDG